MSRGSRTEDWDGIDADGRAWLVDALGPGQESPPPPARPPGPLELLPVFEQADALGASDLHLAVGAPPHVRVGGSLRSISGVGPISAAALDDLAETVMDRQQRAIFDDAGDVDAAADLHVGGRERRVRAAFFRQRGRPAAAFRFVADRVPSLGTLGLPTAVERLAALDQGLVLVTGKTGSGKSTTLAAMVETINATRAAHIITIEDPIEFHFVPQRSIIRQREVGIDTASFAIALRHALRQDPDVILLGELRDLETIRTALTAAETGHLVLATLHSSDAAGAIHRMIDVFPAEQQAQIRSQISLSLEGVISQTMEPSAGGLRPVVEILIATDAVRQMIRDDKVHQIPGVIETGVADGMVTFERSRRAGRPW